MRGRREARHLELERELERLRAPEEHEATGRAVALAAAARSEQPTPVGSILRRRFAPVLAVLAALVAGLVALTPAGADVRGWMAEAIDGDRGIEERRVTELPAAGEVLVASRPGIWLVRADGTRRLLGDYEEASFSPQGLNVVASRENQLVAVDPEGVIRWSYSEEARVADARWAPSGYRVAYRSGRGLSVIAGDGTAPGRLARAVAPVAPSWRPSAAGLDPRFEPNLLTYADERGRIMTVDVDTGERLWRTPRGPVPESIEWSDPDRLVVSTGEGVRLLDHRGRLERSVPTPEGSRVAAVTPDPSGDRLAIVLEPGSGAVESKARVLLARIDAGEHRERTVFSGPGRFGAPSFSPDGRWILLPWVDADQWIFISPTEDRKQLRTVIAVGDIARQFDPGARGTAQPPRVEDWCCG